MGLNWALPQRKKVSPQELFHPQKYTMYKAAKQTGVGSRHIHFFGASIIIWQGQDFKSKRKLTWAAINAFVWYGNGKSCNVNCTTLGPYISAIFFTVGHACLQSGQVRSTNAVRWMGALDSPPWYTKPNGCLGSGICDLTAEISAAKSNKCQAKAKRSRSMSPWPSIRIHSLDVCCSHLYANNNITRESCPWLDLSQQHHGMFWAMEQLITG